MKCRYAELLAGVRRDAYVLFKMYIWPGNMNAEGKGGGVMSQMRLLPPIRRRLRQWLGGYIDRHEILADADRYVVLPPSSPEISCAARTTRPTVSSADRDREVFT